MDHQPAPYFLHVLAILSAFSAVLQLIFLIGDKITGEPFHGTILLISSVLWTAVFWALSNWLKKRNRPHR
jgi:hypothetical protein